MPGRSNLTVGMHDYSYPDDRYQVKLNQALLRLKQMPGLNPEMLEKKFADVTELTFRISPRCNFDTEIEAQAFGEKLAELCDPGNLSNSKKAFAMFREPLKLKCHIDKDPIFLGRYTASIPIACADSTDRDYFAHFPHSDLENIGKVVERIRLNATAIRDLLVDNGVDCATSFKGFTKERV